MNLRPMGFMNAHGKLNKIYTHPRTIFKVTSVSVFCIGLGAKFRQFLPLVHLGVTITESTRII